MKKIIEIFGSIKLSLILFVLFAFCCACATFIEKKFGTQTAWALVYDSFYFDLIQLFLGLNLLCAIFKYKMHKKLPIFIFHVSFLFILIGSSFTRYFGIEGNMHIRENFSKNFITTNQNFISFSSGENTVYKQIYLSVLGFNNINLKLSLDDKKAKLSYKDIIVNAKKEYISGGTSDILRFFVNGDGVSSNFDLDYDEYVVLGDTVLAFGKFLKTSKELLYIDDDYNLTPNFNLKYFDIEENKTKTLLANKAINLKTSNIILYVNDYELSVYDFLKNVKVAYKSSDDASLKNVVLFEIDFNNKSQDVYVVEGESSFVDIDGLRFDVSLKPLDIKLPFSIYLDKFEIKRYISSYSPKSYKSYITINDNNEESKKEIYMNNILDYKGYRFFQSSYDKDEKGSILSVSYDPGKNLTYIGYFLLTFGLVLNLFYKNSRFLHLIRMLSQNTLAVIVICLSVCDLTASDVVGDIKKIFYDYKPVKYANITKDEHFKHFSKILVQTPNSRIAPIDTLSKDLIEKIAKKSALENMEHNELFVNMMMSYDVFKDKQLIYIGDRQIANNLGLNGKKHASFDSFFRDGEYILKKEVEVANRKSSNKRNTYEKEILKLDERINIANYIFRGFYFKVFGVDDSLEWLSPYSLSSNINSSINTQIYFLVVNYFNELKKAYASGDFSLANNAIDLISFYQYKNTGHKIDINKINAEVFFNNAKIFYHLIKVYVLVGAILLLLVFLKILKPKLRIKNIYFVFSVLVFLAFCVHTFGLCLRWYISNHAPWSNSYESMVYISWAIMFSGILFARKSYIALSLSAILSGIMLFGAILAEYDPQITNLVPVLQSHWLSIHVSVITASYGFFGLCALLGIFVLLLGCIPEKYNYNIMQSVKEATYINEISMILGLSLLVIGNFFGAIWANESWGRYWGWDSKETWSLISILIYSTIVHIRFINVLSNTYFFAVFSAFAYWSVMMTYFGVNYFLSGMHSYAKGEIASIPNWVYIIFAIMFALSALVYKNKKLHGKL